MITKATGLVRLTNEGVVAVTKQQNTCNIGFHPFIKNISSKITLPCDSCAGRVSIRHFTFTRTALYSYILFFSSLSYFFPTIS